MTTRATSVLLVIAVLISIGGLRLYQYYTCPFDLRGFLELVVGRGYLIQSDRLERNAKGFLPIFTVHFNQPYKMPESFRSVYCYVMDTDKILADHTLPWSWRQHTKKFLVENGMAFFVERVIVIDGSAIGRKVTDPRWKEGGLMGVYAHEITHLLREPPPPEAISSVEKGTKAMQDGDLPTAERELRHALRRSPWFVAGLDHLGIVLRRSGRFDEAIDVYERSLALLIEKMSCPSVFTGMYTRRSYRRLRSVTQGASG